uniref:CCHC-type domain-containing protein n=1 Tax=Polytomella parva TaxID=51329 RepID=A0A7S0VKP6_9CHLO|mmetsp:Transcript_34096/g.61466  ORF Transcript_34096/g.61466 Transcript_34096/m.61466 type:complete len:483 (+) Transcript_34096:95-1543(+)
MKEDALSEPATESEEGGHPLEEYLESRQNESLRSEDLISSKSESECYENTEEIESIDTEENLSKEETDNSNVPPSSHGKKLANTVKVTIKSSITETNEAPVGVVLVDDTSDIVRDFDLKRLLRQPRYFDDVIDDVSARCFNCGKPGHTARICTNEAREKPCYSCAQFGHEGKDCPNKLCFRCGRPGHLSRECTSAAISSIASICLRCGSADCTAAGRADFHRYEGGCSRAYLASDLRRIRCQVCGLRGHLSCKGAPRDTCPVSCCNCGEAGHFSTACPKGMPKHLKAERNMDADRQDLAVYEKYEQELRREAERIAEARSDNRGFGFGNNSWRDGRGGHANNNYNQNNHGGGAFNNNNQTGKWGQIEDNGSRWNGRRRAEINWGDEPSPNYGFEKSNFSNSNKNGQFKNSNVNIGIGRNFNNNTRDIRRMDVRLDVMRWEGGGGGGAAGGPQRGHNNNNSNNRSLGQNGLEPYGRTKQNIRW